MSVAPPPLAPRCAPALGFVIFDGFELLDLTGPYSILSSAAKLRPDLGWSLHLVAPNKGPVQSGQGLVVHADMDLSELEALRPDTLICIGADPGPIQTQLDDPIFIAALKRIGTQAKQLISICSGAFFLAETGLAKGRQLTSHWRAITTLRTRYPEIEVETDALYVRDGPVWSSAGVTAGMDLSLALVEHFCGRDLALRIARNLLIHRIRSGGQSQFSADLSAPLGSDTRLTQLCEAIRKTPDADWQVEQLCAFSGTSRRSLTRLCQAEFGLPPAQLVERLRTDLARTALVETDASVSQVAHLSGFGSLQRLERSFQRHMNTSPREFRARFRSPFQPEPSS